MVESSSSSPPPTTTKSVFVVVRFRHWHSLQLFAALVLLCFASALSSTSTQQQQQQQLKRYSSQRVAFSPKTTTANANTNTKIRSRIATTVFAGTLTSNNSREKKNQLVVKKCTSTRRSSDSKSKSCLRSSNDDNNDTNSKNENGNNDKSGTSIEEKINNIIKTKDEVIISPTNNDEQLSNSVSVSAARWNRRKQVAFGLICSIAVTAAMAKFGFVPGPISLSATVASSYYDPYTDSMIATDASMAMITSVLAVLLNRMISYGYESKYYDSKTARKITHTLSAPLFMLCWPFFSNAVGAKYFAGLVTLTNILRLYLAGTGDAAESSLVKTISRSGDKSEVFGGPFVYVCLFQFFILAFWRSSFVGVVAMTTLAAGDGMADIIGRRYGRNDKWSYSWTDKTKSKIGTIAFALSSFVCTFGILKWFLITGTITSSMGTLDLAVRIFAISTICSIIEIVPFLGDDNYTVPGSAAILTALLLR